jgi:hypothetical protein
MVMLVYQKGGEKIELLGTSSKVRMTPPWPFSRPEASQPKPKTRSSLRRGLEKDSKPDVLQFQYHVLICSLIISHNFFWSIQSRLGYSSEMEVQVDHSLSSNNYKL